MRRTASSVSLAACKSLSAFMCLLHYYGSLTFDFTGREIEVEIFCASIIRTYNVHALPRARDKWKSIQNELNVYHEPHVLWVT